MINLKADALACALRLRAPDEAASVLRLHPDAARLKPTLQKRHSDCLTTLLWQELQHLESDGRRTSCDDGFQQEPAHRYWARRRMLAMRYTWEAAARTLPSYLRKIVRMSGSERTRACIAVGADVVGHTIATGSARRAIGALSPLGPTHAKIVSDRLPRLRRAPVASPLATHWRDVYNHTLPQTDPEEVLFRIGFALFMSCYHREGDAVCATFAELCRADLFSAMARWAGSDWCPAGHERTAAAVLNKALRRAMSRQPAESAL